MIFYKYCINKRLIKRVRKRQRAAASDDVQQGRLNKKRLERSREALNIEVN